MSEDKPFFTRKQYMNKECSHETYYGQFVTESTRAAVWNKFGKRLLQQDDPHFNGDPTPIWEWDSLVSNFNHRRGGMFTIFLPWNKAAVERAGEAKTQAALVCVAKEAARQIVERVENAECERDASEQRSGGVDQEHDGSADDGARPASRAAQRADADTTPGDAQGTVGCG